MGLRHLTRQVQHPNHCSLPAQPPHPSPFPSLQVLPWPTSCYYVCVRNHIKLGRSLSPILATPFHRVGCSPFLHFSAAPPERRRERHSLLAKGVVEVTALRHKGLSSSAWLQRTPRVFRHFVFQSGPPPTRRPTPRLITHSCLSHFKPYTKHTAAFEISHVTKCLRSRRDFATSQLAT